MAAGDEHVEHVEHIDAVALALGQVDGRERGAAAAHLLSCPACRHEFEEVSSIVGELLPEVPAVQPELGFDESVLRRIGAGRPAVRRRVAWWWAAGAAAALLVAVVAGGWWLARSGGDDDGDDGEVATLELADGQPVGTVAVTDVGDEAVMVVAIVDAPADVSYTCYATMSDGSVVVSEAWRPGAGAWLVPLPLAGEVTGVDLVVTGTDTVWSSAGF